MRTSPTLTIAAAVAALLLAACGSATGGTDAVGSAPAGAAATAASTAPADPQPSAPTAGAGDTMTAGAYLTLAEYQSRMAARQGTKVVYFFHASWCPTCRAAEDAIARDGIPSGLTVVKVDFDSESDLRRQYGVTTQHTFVQVDADGAELAKWTGSQDGAEILAKTV